MNPTARRSFERTLAGILRERTGLRWEVERHRTPPSSPDRQLGSLTPPAVPDTTPLNKRSR